MEKAKGRKKEGEKPTAPERKPHRKIEEPTKPNRQIPEIEPHRKKEEQNFPPRDIPEHQPHITRAKPTRLRP
jgi:hypothetical protein